MEASGFVDRPDYRVDILARRNRVTASVGGQVLAESERCLLVDEQDHGLVFYFPPRTSAWICSCPMRGRPAARSRARRRTARIPDPRVTCSSGRTRIPIPRWRGWPATSPSIRMPSRSRLVWPILLSPDDE